MFEKFDNEKQTKLEWIQPESIAELKLLDFQKEIKDKLGTICKHFLQKGLSENDAKNAPLKGFLLHGPPGTSKTELVKQIYKDVNERMSGKVKFAIIDGANIAAAKWGEAEKNLVNIFKQVEEGEEGETKRILLFDDIDCFIMKRGFALAQEWHYSMNAIFFHQLDRLNPSKIFIFATTNRYDVVDEALVSRLYPWEFGAVSIKDLMKIVELTLDSTKVPNDKKRESAVKEIEKKLKNVKIPTIRDARQFTIFECIDRGLWD